MTQRIESEIAHMIRRGHNASPAGGVVFLRLDGLVYALPNFLERTFWKEWTQILEESRLLQYAKVIPHSYAVMQYYLNSGAIRCEGLGAVPQVVVVLNCDEMMVDCIPYFLEAASADFVQITEHRSSYMAEMTGFKHAEVQFAKLVSEQLGLLVHVAYILLAGPYSRSKYLRHRLEKKLSELGAGNRGAMTLCYPQGCDDVCALGALSHAIGSCLDD
ncbi:hypothetical protein CKAH01_09188 [Colletotrichum kahawae]|uniref:Uncharacterized protein n=1 Tax=Colletotrichum kahawae TaxID=34407 RepID=A0AAE0CZ47_COLKA|nr:hypothetical protein CKAH01_09188 [Colletotrichum kahawae]